MFLGAGSVMHGMNDEVNMRKYGALAKFMPITAITFGFGYLAIIGVPPFAGFYSKDKIIETAFNAGGMQGVIFGGAALLGAIITAFYMTRVMLMTFFGNKRWADDAHPHESPFLMWAPMAILAVGSVASGYLLYSGKVFVTWLAPVVDKHKHEHVEFLPPIVVSALAVTAVIIGVSIAILKYRGELENEAPKDVSIFTRVARRDLLQDDANEFMFMRPGQEVTSLLVKTDENVIDGAVRGVGATMLGSARGLRKLQTGYVRNYALLILIGALAILATIWVAML
jgi:NADH-quinone oxidoreductase subunit L